MKPKVFLKFNRSDEFSYVCLLSWLEIFKNYQIYVVCDLFNAEKDSIPKELAGLVANRDVKFINTNYGLGDEYAPMCKARKRCMAAANLTCFDHISKKDKFLWIIDADDTMFLHKDYEYLKTKLSECEDILMSNNLDGFSLDFYREYNDTWTFGVCLLKSSIDWKKIKTVSGEELAKYDLPINGDSIFDILGRKGIFKLKNFVFNGVAFQHVINNFKKMNVGVYYWNDKKLWDMPLKDDVISL